MTHPKILALLSFILVAVYLMICSGQQTVTDHRRQLCSNNDDRIERIESSVNAILEMLKVFTANSEQEDNKVKECNKLENISTVEENNKLENISTVEENNKVENITARDCYDVLLSGQSTSGIYRIQPENSVAFDVYCDMETNNGGWTVFQRRQDGSVDFYRNWTDYKYGFGNLNGEFWLGNDKIFLITNQDRQYELRIDLADFENETRYALYDSFNIKDEVDNYKLSVSSYHGDAGDSFTYHSGYHFTTKDRDNDVFGTVHCATKYTGAWWYGACHSSNLNGQYLGGRTDIHSRGVVWRDWHGHYYSLRRSEMKIRPLT